MMEDSDTEEKKREAKIKEMFDNAISEMELEAQTSEKNVEWIDCFYDCECYNCVSPNCEEIKGIQKPYLLVFQNPEFDNGKPQVFQKKADVPFHSPIDDFFTALNDQIIKPALEAKKSKKKYRIIAHNGCKYDFIYLMQYNMLDEMKFFGDPVHFKAIVWKDIVYFTDFFLFFRTSLNNLSKDWLGKQKLDHTDFAAITDETWPQYVNTEVDYCIQDVLLLKELWEQFKRSLESIIVVDKKTREIFKYVPNLLITVSHLSLDVFKQCFINTDIYPAPKEIIDDVIASYLGGYVMPFQLSPKLSKERYATYIDFNSHYPAIMELPMPVRYIRTELFSRPIRVHELPKAEPNTLRLLKVTSWRVNPLLPFWHMP